MTIQEVFRGISERIQDTATVKTIYGEPIAAEGKTIIPVARVCYGFGGGGGTRANHSHSGETGEAAESGGGGGGGALVTPVGYIEVTAGESRYVSIEERRKIVRAGLIAFLCALFLMRRRRRS